MPYKPEERLPLTDREKRLYPQVEQQFTDEGYPILKLKPSARNIFEKKDWRLKAREPRYKLKIREQVMKEDIDWPSAWSTQKVFTPSAIPLPIRQSFEEKSNPPRSKYVNTELLKINNFLHLTPKAIERHCEALKKFCTKWPEGLETDEEVRSHFPVTYVTRDYLHTSPTIRDDRARIVELRINIKDLKLNDKDEDKLICLLQHRYKKETGEIVIAAKDCPLRNQNKDHSDFLLTACYFECMQHEKWEDEKPEEL